MTKTYVLIGGRLVPVGIAPNGARIIPGTDSEKFTRPVTDGEPAVKQNNSR